MSVFNNSLTFPALGRDWTLIFNFNALCAFEETHPQGLSAFAFIEQLESEQECSVLDMRRLFWAGLISHHPEVTLIEAGDVMSESPGALMDALEKATPKDTETGKKPQGKGRAKKSRPGSSA